MIDGVVVTCDLLRPDGRGNPGGADRPAMWLYNAIKRPIALACGLQTEAFTSLDLCDRISTLRPAAEADSYWALNHGGLSPSHSLVAPLLDRLHRRFCIGYEMPPWLIRLLDEHRVPYIDIRLHPVRFMDDLMFAVRAASPETNAALSAIGVFESEVISTAGLREAMCRLISEARVPENTLLVAGQRRFDSTQIVGGTFFEAEAHADEIHAICSRYAAVLLKPHPLDTHHSLLAVSSGAPSRLLGVINDNIYRIMALPEISAILTVNSGVAQEAPYFGKTVHTLAPLPIHVGWRGSSADQTAYVSLDDMVLTPDFWRLVLCRHTGVTPADGMRLSPKPNRLRIALDSFWNYQQIDTDRVPHGIV